MELSDAFIFPHVDTYPRELKSCIHRKTWTQMFIAALIIINQKSQQSIYPYDEILYDHKKEWNTDTCYYMIEP